MSSQQSSFRQEYKFPQQGPDRKHRKYGGKGVRHHKICLQSTRPLKQSFYDVVRKAKNVAMFTQTLKQKIAQSKSLNQDNLKPRQLAYLQNDSQAQKANILFTFHSRFILAFDIAFISIMLVYLWAATVQMVFGNMIFSLEVKILTIMVYVMRIVLFNLTEYKNQKFQYISNRKEIQSIYKNEKLFKDTIFLIMVTLQFFPQINSINTLQSIIRLVTIISFSEIIETWQKIQNLLCLSTQAETILQILLLLFKIAIFIHFLSIALNVLAILEIHLNMTPTWIEDSGITFDSDFEKYIVGWYWGATILSTVGFGDITPKNNYERFFVSLVQVICCMTFGYFVNVIGSLFKLRAESEEKYEKLLRSLNRSLNFLSASNDIKHKIRTYFFNRHSIEQMHDPNEEKQVLQNLTPNLKDALLLANNMNMLQKCPSIMKFKQETLSQLAKLMKKIVMAPQTILYSGKTVDRKVWFMQNGLIQQFTDKNSFPKLRKCISNYDEKDSIVGWINFLTQSFYKTLAKSKNFTIAYQLQSSSFLDLIKNDRQQYHKLLHMKDSMILKNRKYTNKCLSCDRYTHNVINCPRIHFIRKNIQKLQSQFKNLSMFINSQKKKKIWERTLTKFNWKNRFAGGQLQKQASFLMNNESNKMNTNTIQNFFKNMMFRQSLIGFQKRKMSMRMVKKQTKLEKQLTEPVQIKEDSQVKSCYSYDQVLEDEQQVYFDKCYLQQQLIQYMPDHHIVKVISGYNIYMKSDQILKRRKILRIP